MQPKCVPSICNHECIKSCPVNAKATEKKPFYAIRIKDNVLQKALINENRCLHDRCGICINACPIQAITTINIPFETDDEPPIHKFEESLFALYRLPHLSQTRILGLLGRNAIGKSTLLEILAGNIKPNGGDFKSETAHKEWLDGLKVPGMKKHFLDTYADPDIIAHKKQNLRYMLEYTTTVGDVLTLIALGERGRGLEELEFFKHYLELEGIWNKKPTILSGGELQRFAIVHTFLQNAKLYLVDEPCTFLDVKQRIKLRRIFEDRVEERKNVLIVEHDLAILDYLTDNIHVLFGTPHVFGVVSRALATKKGINSFLDGFLKEENIQFRKKITFTKAVKERNFEDSVINRLEWSKFERDLGSFHLNVNEGNLFQTEVLVALGENGLGKTTFVTNLAESFAINVNSSQFNYGEVSIKPQQISRSFNGTVDQFLMEKSLRYLRNPDDKLHLLKPLGVWHLLDKQIQELSGGELQRVFIAACLGKEADIYCLDEPSAYLDAEERLKITSVVRNMASKKRKPIIVVEHDLQVVDAIADRIFLFTGKPGIQGETQGPFNKREGMNRFLALLDVTFRRDVDTGRARINKYGSAIDRQQRELGEYYYSIER